MLQTMPNMQTKDAIFLFAYLAWFQQRALHKTFYCQAEYVHLIPMYPSSANINVWLTLGGPILICACAN